MKFLKVLINSLVTGMFFSFLLALLIYDLNINLDFQLFFFGQISLFLLVTYGLLIVILSLLLFFIFQFILGKRFRIAFLSPSFLVLSFSLAVVLFLLIFKANHDYFLSFFDSVTRDLLSRQFLIFIFLGLLGLFCFYGSRRYRKGFIFLIIFYLLFFPALYYALWLRMNYPVLHKSEKVANLEAKRIDKKVTMIGLEGLSFDVMIPLITEEKLPNFAWLMEEGSWGKLESFSPGEPLILNSSINSGKFPAKHRHISLYKYRVLKSSRVFEVAPRFILFGQLLRTDLLTRSIKTHPFYSQDIWEIFRDNKTEFLVQDWPYYRNVEESSPKAATRFNLMFRDLKLDESEMFDRVRKAFFSDFEFEDRVMQMKMEIQPQIVYFMLNGLDTVEQFFYKYSFPDLFGNIDQDDINRYSSVIERYYQFYDEIIGRYLASRKEDELLIVFSPHGIEPLPLWRRIVEWMLGNAEISAYRELAPDGAVFFYGREINREKNIDPMRLIDLAPTLLNYLGLPVGKDMDGIVFSSIFRPEFKLENPVLYISSYEEHVIKQPD